MCEHSPTLIIFCSDCGRSVEFRQSTFFWRTSSLDLLPSSKSRESPYLIYSSSTIINSTPSFNRTRSIYKVGANNRNNAISHADTPNLSRSHEVRRHRHRCLCLCRKCSGRRLSKWVITLSNFTFEPSLTAPTRSGHNNNASSHGHPRPGHGNDTNLTGWVQSAVVKEQAYSAGDYYNGPTPTAEVTVSDTSKVSVTLEEFGPANTQLAGKKVKNGAASMAIAGGMMLGLAALVSSVSLF